MKHLFCVAITICILGIQSSYAAIDDDIDYNFINNAFSNPNPNVNRDFENLMKQYEKPKEGFFTKMYKFFDKDKAKYDTKLKTQYQNPNNQPKRLKDVPDEKPTVLITADAEDSMGNSVKTGYYQVEYKSKGNGKYELILMQGANKNIATLIARPIQEDSKAPSIVYSRSETLNNGYIKVIYANLDLTLLGYLKIKEEEKIEFEPLY